MQAALYASVLADEQNNLSKQRKVLRGLAKKKGWKVLIEAEEKISEKLERPQRESILKAVRRGKVDVILVWKIECWDRTIFELISSLQELSKLGVRLVSAAEEFDMCSNESRALIEMLANFSRAERSLRKKKIKDGIKQSIEKGTLHGRPRTALKHSTRIQRLYAQGLTKSEIARRLGVGRTSVIRILGSGTKIAK